MPFQGVLIQSEAFSEKPFDSVSSDGRALSAAGGEADHESRYALRIMPVYDSKEDSDAPARNGDNV